MKCIKPVCFVGFFIAISFFAAAQKNSRTLAERCGTMQTLELQWQANPALKKQFEDERSRFNNALREGAYRLSATQQPVNGNRTFITIPVVFHVVLNSQALVTDAQILAQLDTLNRDYAGLNGDSVKVPSWFKTVFGHSSIQFCLAQQTPSGDITNGIERVTTTQTSFSNTDNGVKHASSGGADLWDPSSYLNVWICPLGGGLLGYGTFPNTGNTNEQGVVLIKDGRRSTMSYGHTHRLAIAVKRETDIAPGDRLQIKFNGKSKEGLAIANGELVTVRGVAADGSVTIEDDRLTVKTLSPQQRFFNRGYAVTSYASQGKTVDTVLVADAGCRAATSSNQWYVAISRGRKRVLVFTENKAELRASIEQPGDRGLALEMKRPAAESFVLRGMRQRLPEWSRRAMAASERSRLHEAFMRHPAPETNRVKISP